MLNLKVNFVNMTNHEITDTKTGITIPKVKGVPEARADIATKRVMILNGISVAKSIVKHIDIPAPEENTIYIVSSLCLQAMSQAGDIRSDVVSPGHIKRDKKTGDIIGCEGFRINDV